MIMNRIIRLNVADWRIERSSHLALHGFIANVLHVFNTHALLHQVLVSDGKDDGQEGENDAMLVIWLQCDY